MKAVLAGLIFIAFKVHAESGEVASPKPSAAAPAQETSQPVGSPATQETSSSEGKVPSKEGPESPSDSHSGPQKTRELVNCYNYLSNPESGQMLWAGKHLYFVGPKSLSDKVAGTAILFEVDLETLKSKRVIAFNASPQASLVGHGLPIQAVSILDFGSLYCGEGQAAGIGVKWIGEKKTTRSFPMASYKLLPSDGIPELADLGKNIVQQLDFTSSQRRTLASFSGDVIPLYLRKTPVSLYAYKSKENELVRFDNLEASPKSILRLKPGMRLVQQGDKFGILSSKNAGKTLIVSQVKGWSGNDFRKFELILPSGWTESKVSVAVDFSSGVVLALGMLPEERKQLRDVLIYDGQGKKLVKSFQAPLGHYFSHAALAADGSRVVALLRALHDDSVQEVWLEEKGETKRIDLVKTDSEAKTPATKKP